MNFIYTYNYYYINHSLAKQIRFDASRRSTVIDDIRWYKDVTFHHFTAKILRKFTAKTGPKKNYAISLCKIGSKFLQYFGSKIWQ